MDGADHSIVSNLFEVMQDSYDQVKIVDSVTKNYFFDDCKNIKELHDAVELMTLVCNENYGTISAGGSSWLSNSAASAVGSSNSATTRPLNSPSSSTQSSSTSSS